MNNRIVTRQVASVGPDPKAEAKCCMTSDAYFRDHDETFNLIFVDGLHTGDQVCTDISSALNVLNPSGFSLLHDMTPPTVFHAREEYDVDGKFPAWNGTSWEGYAWHRKHSPQLSMCVVDADWGVGVVQNGAQMPWGGAIKGYPVLAANRKELLNLVSVRDFLRRYPRHAPA